MQKYFSIQKGYVFFYGGIFSNFFPCNFYIDGQLFKNSEQAFMTYKALQFNDSESALKILQTDIPSEAKALGRKVYPFDPKKWDEVSEMYMFKACLEKFSQNEWLKEALLNTGDSILVEASPYDRIWGIGMSCNDPDRFDESKWLGENRLGKVLMDVRNSLSKTERS